MTFRGFLVNYLSPFYFLMRCFWLVVAFMGFFFTLAILSSKGWSAQSAQYGAMTVAAFFVWNALRPWKVGASYNEIGSAVRSLEDKIKNR